MLALLLLLNAGPPLDEGLPPGALQRLGTLRLNLGSGASSLAFLPDGSSLLAGGFGLSATLVDARTGLKAQTFASPALRFDVARFALLHPKGDAILALGDTHVLWDIATGKERW